MKRIFLVFVLCALLMSACTVNINGSALTPMPPEQNTLPTQPQATQPAPTALPPTAAPLPTATLEPRAEVALLAQQAVTAIKNREMATLAALVHPDAGLRFSPYAYVSNENLAFTPAQVSALWNEAAVYTWGSYDGSGLPIELSFPAYYDEFLYRADYASAPQISFNQRLGTGNSLDNAAEFYPGSIIVEYYFPGFDPQYSGMDWRSLRLVFQPVDGRWYLSGLINDQWTT